MPKGLYISTMSAAQYFTLFSTLLAALLFGLPAAAAPLYKCDIDGALAFQDAPCPPVTAKQKIACADVDGFAVYQDALSGACNNLPAGTAKNHAVSVKKNTATAKSSKASGINGPSTKARKDVVVRAYTKEDGTQVPSYTRSLPGEKAKQ